MKPKYMVTEVSGPGLVVQALRKTSKPHVLTLLFFLTKLTESDKVISFRCRSRSPGFVKGSIQEGYG